MCAGCVPAYCEGQALTEDLEEWRDPWNYAGILSTHGEHCYPTFCCKCWNSSANADDNSLEASICPNTEIFTKKEYQLLPLLITTMSKRTVATTVNIPLTCSYAQNWYSQIISVRETLHACLCSKKVWLKSVVSVGVQVQQYYQSEDHFRSISHYLERSRVMHSWCPCHWQSLCQQYHICHWLDLLI